MKGFKKLQGYITLDWKVLPETLQLIWPISKPRRKWGVLNRAPVLFKVKNSGEVFAFVRFRTKLETE